MQHQKLWKIKNIKVLIIWYLESMIINLLQAATAWMVIVLATQNPMFRLAILNIKILNNYSNTLSLKKSLSSIMKTWSNTGSLKSWVDRQSKTSWQQSPTKKWWITHKTRISKWERSPHKTSKQSSNQTPTTVSFKNRWLLQKYHIIVERMLWFIQTP